jgi:hypothetical protein
MPADLFIKLLLYGDMSKSSAVLAFMAPNAPLLNPFFLHIGLTALGAYKGTPHVMHHTLFFHTRLTVLSSVAVLWFAQNTLLLELRQAQLERFICSFLIRDLLPRAGP